MAADGQDPPTPVVVFVERAAGAAPAGEAVFPNRWPLRASTSGSIAARRQATRCARESGSRFIDVEGRQCTDFQAFHRARLDEGVERCLDVTTTRSLMGLGYPHPGQRAKYLDQDFVALIEVVQDTCMRHDAFGLACAAKYYEDQGYPGHANCSDNFNTALEPYAIQPRRGWMAMNFFYNTEVDGQNLLVLDEPWSRPGDYVLLRALTDLVCVSSACPDDIDAANGWNPTDIHVRVYPETESFTRAVGHYKQPDADVTMTKQTGFHARTGGLTRDFVEYNGYWLPNSYTGVGPIAEYWGLPRARRRHRSLAAPQVRGAGAGGGGAAAALPDPQRAEARRWPGGLHRHVLRHRHHARRRNPVPAGPGQLPLDRRLRSRRRLATRAGRSARPRRVGPLVTDQLHNLSVQGPLSRQVVSEIVWTPPAQPSIDELGWFRFTIGRLGEPDGPALVVSRTGYTGELGYELSATRRIARRCGTRFGRQASRTGSARSALEALDILRIETG